MIKNLFLKILVVLCFFCLINFNKVIDYTKKGINETYNFLYKSLDDNYIVNRRKKVNYVKIKKNVLDFIDNY